MNTMNTLKYYAKTNNAVVPYGICIKLKRILTKKPVERCLVRCRLLAIRLQRDPATEHRELTVWDGKAPAWALAWHKMNCGYGQDVTEVAVNTCKQVPWDGALVSCAKLATQRTSQRKEPGHGRAAAPSLSQLVGSPFGSHTGPAAPAAHTKLTWLQMRFTSPSTLTGGCQMSTD